MVSKNFDFIALLSGNKLKIEGKIYNVISAHEALEINKSEENSSQEKKDLIRIDLQQQDTNSLHPTHVLKYYNQNEIYFFEVDQKKLSLIKKEKLNNKDIKLIKK